jgi:hypothetical protein
MNEPFIMRETGLAVERQLEEIILIRSDLQNCLATLTFWSNMQDDGESGDQEKKRIAVGLFRDGITQFVNCFDSKNAFPLVVEEVFPDKKGIAEYFRWLRALRNSYTAHRHGSGRQCIVGAMVDTLTGAYLGHGHFLTIYSGPQREGHKDLLEVVAMSLAFADKKVLALTAQFDAEAKLIPPAKLQTLPRSAIHIQDPLNIGKSRGDIKRGRKTESGEGF